MHDTQDQSDQRISQNISQDGRKNMKMFDLQREDKRLLTQLAIACPKAKMNVCNQTPNQVTLWLFLLTLGKQRYSVESLWVEWIEYFEMRVQQMCTERTGGNYLFKVSKMD